MPYKSKRRLKAYLKRWRKARPDYMRDYCRKWRAL